MRSPRELVRDTKNRRSFERIKAKAEAEGLRLHGAYRKSGEPVYFLTQTDATDRDIALAAFEAVNGRQITRAEIMLGAAAEGMRKKVAA